MRYMDRRPTLDDVTNVARVGEPVRKRRREETQGIFSSVPCEEVTQDIPNNVAQVTSLKRRTHSYVNLTADNKENSRSAGEDVGVTQEPIPRKRARKKICLSK